MTLKELEDNLLLRDENVEVKEDTFLSFRIFIYSLMGKRKILTYLDKIKEFRLPRPRQTISYLRIKSTKLAVEEKSSESEEKCNQ